MRASRTAEYVALYRALDDLDPYATYFLSRRLRFVERLARLKFLRGALLRYADRRAPGARTSAMGRTRFIDEAVARYAKNGVKQLVILGAGFDCRAHRMNVLSSVRVFEVDHEGTQDEKRAGIERARVRLAPRRDVVYVTVDFEEDDVAERLTAAGWDGRQPTIFIWEGVTNYLTEPDVAKVLAWIGRCAKGSAVIFTYLHRGVLDGSTAFEGAAKMLANVAKLGEPWRFGILPEEVGSFVARFDLVLRENLGADEYRARFGVPGKGYAFYRLAVAEKS